MKKILKTLLLTTLLPIAAQGAYAETLMAPTVNAKMDGENKVVAMYGNSYSHYNNHINTRLRDLTRSLLPNKAKGYSYRGITTSSARLGWHLETLKFQNTLKDWDVVVFQGNSMEPISKKSGSKEYFQESAEKMSKIAHDAGSNVLYFMTWARKKNPEQTIKLKKAYVKAAEKTGGYIAPVGLAFENSISQHPEIDLYHSDGKHPSLEGTYLAASVLFSTLYNQSPLGGAIPTDTDMSKEVARKLQQIAWETVQEFQK
jgi:hypothetical protein